VVSSRRWAVPYRAPVGLRVAERQISAWQLVHERVRKGTASLDEYEAVLAEQVKRCYRLIKPTVTTVRTVRERRVPVGYTAEPDFDLVRDLLSYRPEERVPQMLLGAASDLAGRAREPGGVAPVARVQVVLAYLVLGPDLGLRRRHDLWKGAGPERAAARTLADFQRPHIASILQTWEPLDRHLEAQHLAAHGEPVPSGMRALVPLSHVATLVRLGLWERPEAAVSGSTRK